MSLSVFLAENALPVENVKYAASPRFVKDGKPVEWEIRCITNEENDAIMKECTRRVPAAPGKRKGAYLPETDFSAYNAKLAAACTVSPNLHDAALQDSYKARGAEALLKAMLTPGEYSDYLVKVQEVCGFGQDFGELVDEVKNS